MTIEAKGSLSSISYIDMYYIVYVYSFTNLVISYNDANFLFYFVWFQIFMIYDISVNENII